MVRKQQSADRSVIIIDTWFQGKESDMITATVTESISLDRRLSG
jgi:hypothetical protein